MSTLPPLISPAPLCPPEAPALLRCGGRLLDLRQPVVMGIVNLTPDSFSDGGRLSTVDDAVAHAGALLAAGATILDLGAVSSRPGAPEVSIDDEWARLGEPLRLIRAAFPQAYLSIDTERAAIAARALEAGADLINDISAGADPAMLPLVARAAVPIVLMHRQGTPATMQLSPEYADVVREVRQFLLARIRAARAAGVADVIVDPGFGFGKTVAHNYQLFNALEQFATLEAPLLVGLSRKSMLTRPLGIGHAEAGPAAAALHFAALRAGARILRVHDVAEAAQLVCLHAVLTQPEHQPANAAD